MTTSRKSKYLLEFLLIEVSNLFQFALLLVSVDFFCELTASEVGIFSDFSSSLYVISYTCSCFVYTNIFSISFAFCFIFKLPEFKFCM